MAERLAQATVYKSIPTLPKHLGALGLDAAKNLDPLLLHLVKLRASQLNGCGFCQNLHAHEARADGEKQQRLDVLPAWKEMPFFSERERAALAWTEALTNLSQHPNIEAAWRPLEAVFDQQEIIHLTVTISVINAWNRIGAGFNFLPTPEK